MGGGVLTLGGESGAKVVAVYVGRMWRRRVPEMLIATSEELADPAMRWLLWEVSGYRWIQPAVRPWQETLRSPVVGQLFEITRYEVPYGMLLVSLEADRIIRRLCG
jgi:hypothetical protein